MASIDELQAQVESLREELTRMREHLARTQLLPVESRPASQLLSRRNLLRAAPMVAAGGALAALSASPAAAAVGDPVLQGKTNNAGAGKTTKIKGGTPYQHGGVDRNSPVAIECDGGMQVDWLRSNGVIIGAQEGAGLYVEAPAYAGLAARFVGGPGSIGSGDEISGVDVVTIDGIGPAVGLTVRMQDSSSPGPGFPGLKGSGIVVQSGGTALDVETSGHAHALKVTSKAGGTTKDAVSVTYAGKGRGLYVESTRVDNANGAVTGVSDGNGVGVWGEHTSTDQSGVGVVGKAGVYGRGAELSGGAAALRLVPGAAKTHPANGKIGDVFVDASARLWFCQKSQVGSVAAKWVRVV
jgi:hypothetical protein